MDYQQILKQQTNSVFRKVLTSDINKNNNNNKIINSPVQEDKIKSYRMIKLD